MRKEMLKELILRLHKGETADAIKKQLIRIMGTVPYGVVVEAEQELISEGLPAREVLKLCDIHSQALKGVVDPAGAKAAPAGHPVHTFQMENIALGNEIARLREIFSRLESFDEDTDVSGLFVEIRAGFNALMDVDKHYRRKENLLFPYLEKYEITGPPTVMWGKDDEVRELLKNAREAFSAADEITAGEAKSVAGLLLKPAVNAVDEMIYKEEEILLPMSLDTLTAVEWFDVYTQSNEIGYCLYDPDVEWKPEGVEAQKPKTTSGGRIQLPSGSFSIEELTALLNNLPVDITFVDREDNVRYFSQGKERIFDRNRAILGRKVQMCHPPSSVNAVQQILDDFHAGRQDSAAFWIQLNGRFIHIEYFALRGPKGEYLGTLEASQDLTEKRKLEGEQRLLSYARK